MITRPALEENGLTYVWQTNAPGNKIVRNGDDIDHTLYSGDAQHYAHARTGRPAGREDHGIPTPRYEQKATIGENERLGYVGIYVLKQ